MNAIIFIVEDIEFEVDKSIIPVGSELELYIKYDNVFKVDRIIHDVSAETFRLCIDFLKSGFLPNDQITLENVIKCLDRLNCLPLDIDIDNIPLEFIKILQEEEWFRNHFNKIGFEYLEDTTNPRLVTLTEDLYEDLELMHLTHWKYINNIKYIVKEAQCRECQSYYEDDDYNSKGTSSLYSTSEANIDIEGKITIEISCLQSPHPIVGINDCGYDDMYNLISCIKYGKEKYYSALGERNHNLELKIIDSDVAYQNNHEKYHSIKFKNINLTDKNPFAKYSKFKNVTNNLKELMPKDFDFSNVLIAGGSVLNMIMGNNTKVNDIDLFVYGLNEEDANKKIENILFSFHSCHLTCIRSINSITIDTFPCKYQIILRLYKNISEILMGFDIDSCCVGFNGKDIFMTPRAHYSFIHMINTVNLKRASPTYNFRLAKYMQRGFAVFVPDLETHNIDDSYKTDAEEYYKLSISDQKYRRHLYKSELKHLSGINYLLIMSRLRIFKEFTPKSDYEINNLSNQEPPHMLPKHLVEIQSKWSVYGKIMIKENPYTLTRSYIITTETKTINDFTIPDDMYHEINFAIPQSIQWKSQNPGEQLTNTFNITHINNPSTWYVGKYYQLKSESPIN